MSIRLRLTLLYSVILALTLVAFSVVLYVIQSTVTYDAIETTLEREAQDIIRGESHRPKNSPDPAPSPGVVMVIPGRWTQMRGADGSVLARTADLADTPLPLSDTGLLALQSGQTWAETAQVDGGPVLIYSAPITNPSGPFEIVEVATPMAEREQSLTTLRWILVIGSSLVILAAFAIGWVLAGTALGPIHRITGTAQAIGAERNFGRRVRHDGPNDEIGQLVTTFNTMLTELESAYRQVEQALQAQRRFVADASHELRTPLTTIRGNIELLRRVPPLDARERSEITADATDEVERLIRLVQQLLTLARADAGRPLRQEPFPLEPLLEDVYRQAQVIAPERTILCTGDREANVLGDRDALKQVLLILTDNALVHTPPEATVRLSATCADGQVAIDVADTGAGIAPELLPHIFERFVRGNVSRTGGGAGLGLSIAKELMQAQNGSISVVSRAGQGSTFTVKLAAATNGAASSSGSDE